MSFPCLKNKPRRRVSREINHLSCIGKSPGNLLWHQNVVAPRLFMFSSSNPTACLKILPGNCSKRQNTGENLDGELVGRVSNRAERSGRKASHPGGTAVRESTQPCKASRRAFAWLEKGNYEGRMQQDKGNHREIQGGRSRASHLHRTSTGCQVVLFGYHLPDGFVGSQKPAVAAATNEFRLMGSFLPAAGMRAWRIPAEAGAQSRAGCFVLPGRCHSQD